MKKIVYFFLWLFWTALDKIVFVIYNIFPFLWIEDIWDRTTVNRCVYARKIFKEEYKSFDEWEDEYK